MPPSWIRRIFRFFRNESGTSNDEDATSNESSPSIQSPGQRDSTDDDDEGFGMHVFVDKPANESGVIDLVALHGLNGHYSNTWTATSPVDGRQVNWLNDLLPGVLPNARVMSFRYNSIVQFSKGTAGISGFTEQLLEAVMAWRTPPEEKRRPVIFICHSLGGIVFKQAVVRARERDRFTGLLESIRGVAFFGTPRRGSSAAIFGAILASILKVSTFGTNTNSKLVSQLKENSETLFAINSSLVDRSKNLVITSFCELEEMD
ncbi:hypothetical protein INS49_014811 [Diaporthe citri]|uniref:uncharacterized protein n=1 Tax=Diaporthe citri TaxID=83186 RepID=UPI001C7E55FD|nr:uncharacterized protein INS49_014811 [Diaporthe citri]KAG6356936.1 hypothetical protein INS49_014811 [Diaporthe citri]